MVVIFTVINHIFCYVLYVTYVTGKKEWKEGNVLFTDALNTFLFIIIWRQTYGRGPLRERERKPAAAAWATLSD